MVIDVDGNRIASRRFATISGDVSFLRVTYQGAERGGSGSEAEPFSDGCWHLANVSELQGLLWRMQRRFGIPHCSPHVTYVLPEARFDLFSAAQIANFKRATRRNRTGDLLITNQLLYLLS